MTAPDEVIQRYFAAMRRGAAAETEMMALFADDAVYIDPFSGSQREAHGKEQIRRALRRGWETPLPDLELEVRTIEITGNNARSRWTCRSPALPGPVDGIDNYTIVDGKITRLEVVIEPADG